MLLLIKGEIESISYAENAEMIELKINTIIANPEGLVTNQTTTIKGAGSALLDHMIQEYKMRNVNEIQLFSTNNKNYYYANRGWREFEEFCESETPTLK